MDCHSERSEESPGIGKAEIDPQIGADLHSLSYFEQICENPRESAD
jgi:hypothetical protein